MTPAWLAEADEWKTRLLDRLAALPPAEQRRTPSPRDWSPAQVVGHLVVVEERLVTDWRAAALASPDIKPSLRGALALGFATSGMKSPFRVPTVAALEPGESEDVDTLSRRWGTARRRLPGTLPSAPSDLWIIHPMFGPVSSSRIGPFLVVHLQHHWKHWPGSPPAK